MNLKKNIRKNLLVFLNEQRLRENYIRQSELFRNYLITENDDLKRNDVIDAINNNEWEKKDAKRFSDALKLSKHIDMLHIYSIDELNQMKLFKLKNYNIGFALKKKYGKFSEIVSVFNNEPEVKGIGKELIKSAIENGGRYLDHFDGFLSDLYSSMGFVEYDRWKFDPKYDEGGKFEEKYGKSDVILRVHKDYMNKENDLEKNIEESLKFYLRTL